MPKQAAAGADHAGTVRAHQPHAVLGLVAPHVALDPDHVLGGDAVGDRDADPDAGVGRLHDRIGGVGRRDEHDAGGRTRGGYGVLDGIVHGPAMDLGAALPGRDPAHHVGAVCDHLLGVEGADLAGDALDQHAGGLVDQDGHGDCLLGLRPPGDGCWQPRPPSAPPRRGWRRRSAARRWRRGWRGPPRHGCRPGGRSAARRAAPARSP